jgi:acetoin utilization deacetylase AcuC-like enzyme
MTVAYFEHPDTDQHQAPGPHPERPARTAAVRRGLAQTGLLERLSMQRPAEASTEALERVHPPAYLEALERAARAAQPFYLDPDTFTNGASLHAARLAAGAAVEAVDGVLTGRFERAFLNLRPPGHHCLAGSAMGFCLLNQAAIAARHAQAAHGLARVFILDWDVHHGNGTQAIFERDPNVYYASLHEWPLYPGTGRAEERGLGAGLGTLLNCPLPGGAGEPEWLAALEGRVLPEIERFQPELLLLSCGFDAHARDPLAHTELTSESFGRFTRVLREALERTPARGRLVSLLEGGYDEIALAESAAEHVAALLAP